jgi:polysaccharide export outer membrane protein
MKRLVLGVMALWLALSMGAACAVEQLLGPGDVVKISVYGNPDLAVETRVSEAGFITVPLIGQVSVIGIPSAEAEKKIADALESGGFVKSPQVNIIVTVLQSQQISVLGQVNRPGRYPVEGRRSVLDMLALAGGISPDGGDLLTVIRKREGKNNKDTVDVVDLFRSGDLKTDFELSGGDVIFVERAPRFYIYGEVQRPGPVRLERRMTVLQALSAGGGLTQRGTERGIRIKRRDADGKIQVLEIQQDALVQPDDVIYVKESWF